VVECFRDGHGDFAKSLACFYGGAVCLGLAACLPANFKAGHVLPGTLVFYQLHQPDALNVVPSDNN
jgi:hypothetical protein